MLSWLVECAWCWFKTDNVQLGCLEKMAKSEPSKIGASAGSNRPAANGRCMKLSQSGWNRAPNRECISRNMLVASCWSVRCCCRWHSRSRMLSWRATRHLSVGDQSWLRMAAARGVTLGGGAGAKPLPPLFGERGRTPSLFAITWFQNITSPKHDVYQRSIVKACKIALWWVAVRMYIS